jgi:hypothetical protein
VIKVRILNEARSELVEAVEYYEDKTHGLGIDLINEIKSSVEIIRRFPNCCALRKDKTRRYLINRFPYLIIYLFHKGHIWIIAFAHCKRKPEYWTKRINKQGNNL